MTNLRLSKSGAALAGLHLTAVIIAAVILVLGRTWGAGMLSAAALGLLGAPWTQLLLASADAVYPNWLAASGLPLAVVLTAGALLNAALLYLLGTLAGRLYGMLRRTRVRAG